MLVFAEVPPKENMNVYHTKKRQFLIILDDYYYNICVQEVEKVAEQPQKTNRSQKGPSFS